MKGFIALGCFVYRIFPKYQDKQDCANSVDPD